MMLIIVVWDYNVMSWGESFKGNLFYQVVVLVLGVVVGVYVQVIFVYVLYLNVVKFWMEYFYLDEGQIEWLKGFCYLICFNVMVKVGKILVDLFVKLLLVEVYVKVIFLMFEEQVVYKKMIIEGWDKVVGVNVK